MKIAKTLTTYLQEKDCHISTQTPNMVILKKQIDKTNAYFTLYADHLIIATKNPKYNNHFGLGLDNKYYDEVHVEYSDPEMFNKIDKALQ